jgi:hypothetical protein
MNTTTMVPTRYWCKSCGSHFNGNLRVDVQNGEKIRVYFIHDPCPYCQVCNTSPHARIGMPVYAFDRYVETVRLSLGDNHCLTKYLQKLITYKLTFQILHSDTI